ncbi:MAG: gluconokinase [Bacteroidota bacterium]|nr:gluconokinase [Bacteroidota bacterium]
MGVSGSGKSTVGNLLAKKLDIPFYDADDFHPLANLDKMNAGVPLTDVDRQHWLEELAASVKQWDTEGGAVLACSALKEKYRQTLQAGLNYTVQWIYLEGTADLLQERLQARSGHFMPPALLQSQLAALEKPTYALDLDVAQSPEILVEQIITQLRSWRNYRSSDLSAWE